MDAIVFLGGIGVIALAGWLLSKIVMPILNLISLILIGETLT